MRSIALLFTFPLIACGGDDGGGGGVVVPDAKVFMDAPAMAACMIPATVPGGSLGSDTMRQSLAWIGKTMQGATRFAVSIPIDEDSKHWLNLIVPKPGATWTKNAALSFQTDPTAQTAQAIAFLEENYNEQTEMADRIYWASAGSINFSEIDQTAGAKITFTTTASNFREINDAGADVAGGCTSMIGALTVYLQQSTAVMDGMTVTAQKSVERPSHHIAVERALSSLQ